MYHDHMYRAIHKPYKKSLAMWTAAVRERGWRDGGTEVRSAVDTNRWTVNPGTNPTLEASEAGYLSLDDEDAVVQHLADEKRKRGLRKSGCRVVDLSMARLCQTTPIRQPFGREDSTWEAPRGWRRSSGRCESSSVGARRKPPRVNRRRPRSAPLLPLCCPQHGAE